MSRASGPGWLDTVRDAADLALLGVLATLGSLGVVTMGAAVATASAALHHWRQRGSWPAAAEILRRYARALLPGIPVSVLAVCVAALLVLNISAFDRGLVPGGTALIWATLLLAAVLSGYAALTVVEVGHTGGRWRPAARRAAQATVRCPVVIAALAGVTVLGGALAVTVIPVAAPILVGYLLFAQHAVARRLLGDPA